MNKLLIILLIFVCNTANSQIKWENVVYSTGGVVLFGVADYVLYNELKDGDLSVYRYIVQPALDLAIGSALYLLTDDIKVSISYGLMRMSGASDLVYYGLYGGFGNDKERGFTHLKSFIPFTSKRSVADILAWNGFTITVTIFLSQ